MKKQRGRPTWLDRKRCFELWVELGSIDKVRRRLESEGIVNPTTKKAASNFGISAAAYKYMVFNPVESRKVFQHLGFFGEGKDDDWIEYLKEKAVCYLSTRLDRYNEWERDYLDEYIRGLKEDN